MKIVKRIGLSILITVAALLTVLVAVFAWVLHSPEGAWRLAERTVLPRDLQVRWQKFDLNLDHGRWFEFRLRWHLAGVRIDKTNPRVSARVQEFSGLAEVSILYPRTDFAVPRIRLLAPEPIEVRLLPAGEPEQTEPESSPYETVRRLAETIRDTQDSLGLAELRLDVQDLRIYSPGTETPTRLSAFLSRDSGAGSPLDLRFSGRNLSASVREVGLEGRWGADQANEFRGKLAASGPGLKLSAPLLARQVGERITFETEPDFSMVLSDQGPRSRLRTRPRISAELTPEAAVLSFEGRVRGIPGPVRSLRRVRADFRLPFRSGRAWDTEPVSFRVDARVPVFFLRRGDRAIIEEVCGCKMPRSLLAGLEGQAWLSALAESRGSRKLVADAALELESIENQVLDVQLGATARAFLQNDTWAFEPTLDSRIVVHRFQALRRVLDAKNVMVPAPFHVLDGELALTMQSPVEFRRGELAALADITTAAEFTADLSSRTQSVKLASEVLLSTPADFSRAHADVKARIDSFQLELPPLSPFVQFPPLSRDSRIRMQPRDRSKKREEEFKFTMNLAVETATPGAVRLLSPLAHPHVPITFRVERSADGTGNGVLIVEPFEVRYLRRKLFVDSLRIDLDRGDADGFPIQGEFHVDQTEYKVMIHLAGTTDQPQIKLSSDPYLDHDDIVSVLLFDRTSDELVGSDSETAGNVQAAIADRAVGLFGLWAFASTPIRSFSYNSVTKTYSATLAIGDGLTAGVGTTSDQAANFEVRKRLSRRWAVTASWKPEGEEDQAGRVVLQWERRF